MKRFMALMVAVLFALSLTGIAFAVEKPAEAPKAEKSVKADEPKADDTKADKAKKHSGKKKSGGKKKKKAEAAADAPAK